MIGDWLNGSQRPIGLSRRRLLRRRKGRCDSFTNTNTNHVSPFTSHFPPHA